VRAVLLRTRFLGVPAVAALGIGLAAIPVTAHAGGGSSVVKVPAFLLPLTRVGQVNLGSLARERHRGRAATGVTGYRLIGNSIVTRRPKGTPKTSPDPAPTRLSTRNVRGESGFSAVNSAQEASVYGFDLEPPDQGLCAGGGYVMEFINDAVAIYDQHGVQLLPPVRSPAVFGRPKLAPVDPRCYYDAPTKRWFLQEFTLGRTGRAGKLASQSREFEAVSDTQDPTGSYTVYSWVTTDAATAGCPCFGDYDNLGADGNGIYITTNELGLTSGADNGVIVYAISKEQIENVATTGALPAVAGYRLMRTPFGTPEVIAPASTPPGARFARDTEYFAESDSNGRGDNHLLVYALHNTSLLAAAIPPTMYRAEVTTEGYSFPVDARQKPGPRPLGKAFQDPEAGLQADFDAEMEPTYVGGQLYAQLDTRTASGSDAAAWFILKPALSGKMLSVSVAHQGFVAVNNASLLYPYTAVNASGAGYLLFSLSGPDNYPSPAYIAYGATGPAGPVIVAAAGAAPEDSFSCYPAFTSPLEGGCRWGDYSMGAVMNGRVYMATEMVPQTARDTLTNWGTFIWSAPPPRG
jgi:hypothetical protein